MNGTILQVIQTMLLSLNTYLPLPGNPNYLKESMKVDINLQGALPCFAPHSGKLKMKAKLYSTTGATLSSALMANYNFIWTNSATVLIKTRQSLHLICRQFLWIIILPIVH